VQRGTNKLVYHIRYRRKLHVTKQTHPSIHPPTRTNQTTDQHHSGKTTHPIPSHHVKTKKQTPSSQSEKGCGSNAESSSQRRTKAKLNPSHLHTSPQAPSSDENKGRGRAKSRQESKSHPKREPVSQCFILPKGAGARRSGSFAQQLHSSICDKPPAQAQWSRARGASSAGASTP